MLRISSISASIRLIRFPCFRYFLRYDFFALFSFFKFSVCNGIHLRCNVILPCQIFRNAYALVSRSLKSLQRLCIMPALQFLIMLLSVPFFFFLPIFGLLIIALGILIYFQEKQKVDSCIKEKRRQIEFDLPRLVYAISQEIQMTHDVISILERHKDNFSPYLNEEIAITIADMRTGNYEAAIIWFEGRIGSTNLSEVCRGFIQMIRGDDTAVYWETLSVRFEELQRQHLRSIALKIPPKVHRLSFFLMMCMMLLYVVVLGWELISNMGILFG